MSVSVSGAGVPERAGSCEQNDIHIGFKSSGCRAIYVGFKGLQVLSFGLRVSG